MSRKARHKVIAFALEATYGVDAVDGGSPLYVLGTGFEIDPLVGDDVDLDYDDGKGGNSLQLLAGNHAVVRFSVHWTGANDAAVTPAKYSALLQACLRTETIGASDVRHSMDEAGNKSLTLYFHYAGALHKLTGARGNVVLTANAKTAPTLAFTFTGLFEPVTAVVNPVADFTGWVTPLLVGVENTAATLGGNAIKLIEFSMDQGNQVSYQEYVGHQEVELTDFGGSGTLVAQAPDLATFNPFDDAVENAELAFVLTHGPALNQTGYNATLQLGRPTYGDQNGTLTYSIPFRVQSNTDYFLTK